MSRHWIEKLDPERHADFMSTTHVGGLPVDSPRSNLEDRLVYFVAVAGFTFQFVNIDQLRDCLKWFRDKIHPSSRTPDVELEHYWQRWYERLPKGITKEPNRQKVVAALERALTDFQDGLS